MAVAEVIDDNNLEVTIRGLRPVVESSASKLRRVYEVVLSDGRTLELVMPPPPMLRLLRSERQVVESEVVVVRWLGTVLDAREYVCSSGSTLDRGEGGSSPDGDGRATGALSGASGQSQTSRRIPLETKARILQLLPEVVAQSASSAPLGGPYAIYQQSQHTSLAKLATSLTEPLRADVDFQLGSLARQLAEVRSPTGRFGHVVSVLSTPRPSPGTRRDGSRSPTPSASGSPTWSAAFNTMFEGVLRDAEDMAVMLAYPTIRRHLARLSYVLDEVTDPSLVLVDGLEDASVLVALREGTRSGHGGNSCDEISGDEDSGEEEMRRDGQADSAPLSREKSGSDTKIVGLRSWANCVFGDPLLATIFSNNPPDALVDGFYYTTPPNSPSPRATPEQQKHDISAQTRLLLYQAYHATVAIVTEFYRPRDDSTARELAARRKLTEALVKLDEVEDEEEEPKERRRRRLSGEVSTAKKIKPGEKQGAKG